MTLEVILMRGLSGSGKSTRAATLAAQRNCVIVSADHYFTDASGRYSFNIKQLSKAHDSCLLKYIDALLAGKSVVVDNVNSSYEHFEKYLKIALLAGAKISVEEITSVSVDECIRRNIHGVTADVVRAQHKKWDKFDINTWIAEQK